VTKSIVSQERRASEADRLRQVVNAYRAERGSGPTPAPTKPAPRRLVPTERPTPIEGFPFTDSPPAEVPDYGTMGRVQAIKHRQRKVGARLPSEPVGPTQLIKRRDYELRTRGAAE
jgi:hypothetical protein